VPNVLLIVAGQAHPVLGQNYLEHLQALSNTLGVARFVKFHSSFLQEADLLQLYQVCSALVALSRTLLRLVLRPDALRVQSADVFLCAHTSAEQTSSGTMLFAMTSGVAVVATPFAQAAELLTDGSGVLVPFNDAGALAEAVRSVMSHLLRIH
jgi:glycosyltransferase involved in cell wall biosynthesis